MEPIHVFNMGFQETQDLFRMETTRTTRMETFSSFIFYFFRQEAVSRFAHVLVREKLT